LKSLRNLKTGFWKKLIEELAKLIVKLILGLEKVRLVMRERAVHERGILGVQAEHEIFMVNKNEIKTLNSV